MKDRAKDLIPILTDADLINTPDKELQDRCEVMSFDIDKMVDRVNGGAWHNVVQAHLYYDHIVSSTISENVTHPKALGLERLSFSQKLAILSALDLIRSDFAALLRRINKLRNTISHDLDFELTEEDIGFVLAAVPSDMNEAIILDSSLGEGITFQKMLVVTILLADLDRQKLAKQRIMKKKGELRLRAALDSLPPEYRK